MFYDVAPPFYSREISEVSHSGIVRVFHEFVKHPTITEIESKQYVLDNLFVIINTLGALYDHRLKYYYCLRVSLLARNL